MQRAPDIPHPHAQATPAPAERRTPLEMVGEVVGLLAGAVSALLPVFLLSMPGIVLFVLFPLMLAAIPAVIAAVLLAPPYLVVRTAWRWSRRRG
ncbi:MAG: hypothetical protein WBD40_17150 [Tepidisphaeraceae bacterium]